MTSSSTTTFPAASHVPDRGGGLSAKKRKNMLSMLSVIRPPHSNELSSVRPPASCFLDLPTALDTRSNHTGPIFQSRLRRNDNESNPERHPFGQLALDEVFPQRSPSRDWHSSGLSTLRNCHSSRCGVFGQLSTRYSQRRPSRDWHSSCCGVTKLRKPVQGVQSRVAYGIPPCLIAYCLGR